MEIPREFARLLDNDWREAAVYGSRYSLKSGTVARILLIRARQNKIRIGCFREFQSSIADSSHQLLKDLIEEYNLTDFKITDNAIINTVNGSDFLFRGLHRNEQSIKSIEGLDIGWVEEAQTVSQKSIDILTPTIRKDKSQIIYTYNRLLEEDPIHKRLVLEGRPNTLIIKTDYLTALKYNYLSEVIKKEAEDDKKYRPNLFKFKWLGEPESQTEGKIYPNWQVIDEVPAEARLERYGLDFGYFPDPACLVQLFYWNGSYVADELLYQRGLDNMQLAAVIKNQSVKVLTVADSAEPKSIAEISSMGVSIIPVEKGPDSKRHGIRLVQGQKIFLTKRSVNIWREQRNYVLQKNKEGILLSDPVDGNDHGMDAIRYGIMSLIPVKRREEYIQSLPPHPSWATKEVENPAE